MKNLYKLNEYAVVINGGAWSENEYSTTGIKVVKVTNMIDGTINDENISYLPLSVFDKYKAHILHTNDLVLATVGSHPDQPNSVVGKTATIPMSFDGAFLNQNAACIRVTEKLKVEPRYLKYLTKTVLFKHHVESRARGSANQVRLAISELKKFTCQFPHLTIQKKIAAMLSSYDDLIENNNRRIAILEKMAEEMYREWFVRLRFPGHENVKIVKGVPEGWEVKRLSDLVSDCNIETGKRPKGGAQAEGIPSIGAENVIGIAKYDYSKEKYVGEDFFNKMTQGIIKDRDILFYKDGAEIGRVSLFQDDFPHQKCAINEHVFLIRADDLDYQYYIYFYLATPSLFEYVQIINKNAAQPGINKSELKSIPIIRPRKDIIDKFNLEIGSLIKEIFYLSKMQNKLIQIRDRLLSRLMSGKIDVENMDIQFPASMRCAEPAEAQEEAVHA